MGGTVTSAPWKQLLLDAMESNAHFKHSSFFQLATVGYNGRPSNRTVVFRGFEEDSDKIQINTDCRSRKSEELKHCPFAEICWYFTDSWEQFRINGTIETIDGSNPDPRKLQERKASVLIFLPEIGWILQNTWLLFTICDETKVGALAFMPQREKCWFASSLNSRLQYLGPNPGFPRLNEEPPKEVILDHSTGPVGAFCVLALDPEQVDYLNLKSNQRLIFTSAQNVNGDKCWTSEEINP